MNQRQQRCYNHLVQALDALRHAEGQIIHAMSLAVVNNPEWVNIDGHTARARSWVERWREDMVKAGEFTPDGERL
jgi:hypothetical protein